MIEQHMELIDADSYVSVVYFATGVLGWGCKCLVCCSFVNRPEVAAVGDDVKKMHQCTVSEKYEEIIDAKRQKARRTGKSPAG
jgi:hypothetical protein